MKAYVLINVKTGSERDMYQRIKEIKNVIDINELYGEWDIIVKVEIENVEQLDELITEKIRNNPGIKATMTMIVAQ